MKVLTECIFNNVFNFIAINNVIQIGLDKVMWHILT